TRTELARVGGAGSVDGSGMDVGRHTQQGEAGADSTGASESGPELHAAECAGGIGSVLCGGADGGGATGVVEEHGGPFGGESAADAAAVHGGRIDRAGSGGRADAAGYGAECLRRRDGAVPDGHCKPSDTYGGLLVMSQRFLWLIPACL